MEQCLGVRYFFVSPYSPELKPIERIFSLIRSWIRDHEAEVDPNDPIALIERAFELHSVRGMLSFVFDLYRENRKRFLEEHSLDV